MKYLGLGLLMLLVCFMFLIFLSPGDDLLIDGAVTLYNTQANIVRGNSLILKDATVNTGNRTPGKGFRAEGAAADMGIFPMEVAAGDTVIITSPYLKRFNNKPHCGIDLCVSGKPESTIVATRDGIVTKVYAGCGKSYGGSLDSCPEPHTESFGYTRCGGYGNHVIRASPIILSPYANYFIDVTECRVYDNTAEYLVRGGGRVVFHADTMEYVYSTDPDIDRAYREGEPDYVH